MLRKLPSGAPKLAVALGAMLAVACAGTAEQGGYKELTRADVPKVSQGMTRQEVEQALGSPQKGEGRDREGNLVLYYAYHYSGATVRAYLFVTIDKGSGKVVRVETQEW